MGSPLAELYKKQVGSQAPTGSPLASLYGGGQTTDITPQGPIAKPSQRGDFTTGLISSMRQGIPESVGGFLKTIGLEELGQNLSDFGTEGAPDLTGKVTSLRQIRGVGDIADYLQFQVGAGVGYMLPSIAGGVAGGAAGTAVGGPAGGAIGAMIGAIAPSYVLNTGQVQQELEKLGESDRKGLALLLGVPIAALDAITPGDLANRIVGKQIAKKAAESFAKRALKTGGREGLTESAQQLTQEIGTRAATGQPIQPGQRAESALEAGVAGAVTGTAVGGFSRGKPLPPVVPPGTPLDPKDVPTPAQLIERQAQLNKIAEQTKKTVTKKKEDMNVAFTAVRAWSGLNPEQRKAAFPGLADSDYLKGWKDLDDEAKTTLRGLVKSSTDNQGRTASPSGEGAGPDASIQATITTPPAGLPDVNPSATIQSSRDQVEQQVADQARAREAVVPPQADLTAIEQELEGADAARRQAREAELATRDAKLQESINKLKQKVDPQTPRAIEQLAAELGITPDQMIERMRKSTPQSIEKLAAEDDVTGTIKPTPPTPSGLPISQRPGAPPLVPVTPGQVVGEIKPATQKRITSESHEETLGETIANLSDEDLLLNLDGVNPNDPDYSVWLDAAIGRGLKVSTSSPSPIMDLLWTEGLRDKAVYGKKQDVTRIAKAIRLMEKGDRDILDRLYDSLIRQHEAGTIDPQSTRLLKNLQAIDEHIAKMVDKETIAEAITSTEPSATSLSTGEPSQTSSEPTQLASPTPQASSMNESVQRGPVREDAPLTNEGNLARRENELKAQRKAVAEAESAFDAILDELDKLFESNQITRDERTRQVIEAAKIRNQAIKDNPVAGEEAKAASVAKPKVKMPDTVGKDLSKLRRESLINARRAYNVTLQNPQLDPDLRVIYTEELSRVESHMKRRKMDSEGGFLALPHRRVIKKMEQASMTPSQKYMSERIVLEPDTRNSWNWLKRLRSLYMGTLRSSEPNNIAVKLFESHTGQKISAENHPGKLMEMMDGALTQAEGFLRGDGPYLPDGFGGYVPSGSLSLAQIGELAQGRIEEFGWLWASMRALEQKALHDRDIGIDLAHAQEIFLNSPQFLHDAVKAGRDYHMSLAQLGFLEGMIAKEALDKFAQETSYGPIQRVFDEKLVRLITERMHLTGQTADQIIASQPFQRLKGSQLPIRNMFESSIDVTYRIIKAGRMNKFGLALVDMALAEPDLYKGIIERVDHKMGVAIQTSLSDRTKAVKAMFGDAGIDISDDHATIFANLMSDNALGIEGGVLQVLRNGKIELWKVDDLLVQSIKSMSPPEFGAAVRFLGKAAQPLRLGIVLDPMFIAMQTVIDQFQGWTNTRYGFIPVLDSFRGWWNLVKDTPMAREALRAGGVERAGLRVRTSLEEVLAGPNPRPREQALNHVKQMSPLKAINALLTPIREATRMGEYLRAREHGASPIEAVWAARDLLGNYSVEGTFTTIRALNMMSAFGRPALAVFDKTARTLKERPAQWFLRASTLAIGASLLYAANDDDEEIAQLRQTPDGQRWFFFRVDGQIYKWRKPYLEGAIFASGIEAVLDQMKGENPEAFKLWAKAMKNEVALNMLPLMGVVVTELWANKSIRTSAPIIPEYEKGLDPEYQTGPFAGTFERQVGEMGGVSPGILNYVIRGFGGYWGESFARGISAAMDWNTTHELPPKEDWPLTQRILARYPTSNTKDMREFYDNMEEVDVAAKTLEFAYNFRPDRIESELQQHEAQLPLIEIYNDARQQIADLRESMGQLDDIQDIGPSTKRAYRDEFLRTIIEVAKAANEVARAIKEANSQATTSNPNQNAAPTSSR